MVNMMNDKDYSIRIARYSFTCPITGIKIRKGDEYIETEGVAISLKAGLPERNLKLIKARSITNK
jgi:hypothetical protein